MTSAYPRKVDQQRLYVSRTVEVIAFYRDDMSASALVQAGYLQLEMALRLYLFELLGKDDGLANISIGQQSLLALHKMKPTPELGELVSLSQQRTSWLSAFTEQLSGFWAVERSDKLRGAIFQIDEQSREENLISATDVSGSHVPANLEDLQVALIAFNQLVERHRTGGEEY